MLADDSGLEIDALGGRPGVVTAYYGGADLTWAQRREYVLVGTRRGSMRASAAGGSCATCTSSTKTAWKRPSTHRSTARSRRASAAKAVSRSIRSFVYPAAQKTFAELTATEKNNVSHRKRAVSALLHELRKKQTRTV